MIYLDDILIYSDIVIPLTCLIQKDITWKFDSSCYNAFNSLKKAFTSAPILTYWIPDTQLIVKTDALYYALAAILSIVNKENEVHLVSFHSHTFTTMELNYDIYNKELLAISLDNRTSTLKGEILAMPQSTLTTSNLSSLKNNL